MNQSDSVFSFQSDNQNSQRLWSWLTALATAASAALLCYAFLDAVGGSPDPLYAAIAVITVAIETCLLPHKKAFFALNAVLVIGVAVLVATNFSTYVSGGFLMLNRTFIASQEAQSYVYQMMTVTVDETAVPFTEFFFNSVTLFVFSAILSYYALKKIPFLPIVVLFITTVSEQYFGVAPSPLLNVALYLSLLCLVMASGYKGSTVHNNTLWQTCLAVVLVAAALLSSTFFIYPARYHEHNPYIDEINEKIRDWLDKDENLKPENQPDNDNQMSIVEQNDTEQEDGEKRDLDPEPVQEEPDDIKEKDDPDIDDGSSANPQPKEGEDGQQEVNSDNQNSQKKDEPEPDPKVINIWLLLPLLLLLIAALIWAVIVIVAAGKRKKRLTDSDNDAVIQYAFTQSVKWLRRVGLPKKNVPQSALKPAAEQLFDSDYAAEYETAVNTWQESLYSNKAAADYRKEEMLTYYALTKKQAWHKANPFKKLRIKLIDLL